MLPSTYYFLSLCPVTDGLYLSESQLFVNKNASVSSWISEDSMLKMALNLFYYNASITSSWRRKWQHTRGFLPGKSHGQKSLVGYAWGPKESNRTEHTHSFLLWKLCLSVSIIYGIFSQLFMVFFPSLSITETVGT